MKRTKRIIAIERSEDSKLSDGAGMGVSATYAPQLTCPASCPLFGNGCYAEMGNVAIHARRLHRAALEP